MKNLIDRFWAKVDKKEDNECWEWTGGRNNWNYGILNMKTKIIGAHRMAWILTNGEISNGLLVLHRCDNPPCCNPNHLFLGTQKDNMIDAISKGRHSSCHKKIHPKSIKQIKQNVISSRDLEILRLRRVENKSLRQISRIFDITHQRVSQILIKYRNQP